MIVLDHKRDSPVTPKQLRLDSTPPSAAATTSPLALQIRRQILGGTPESTSSNKNETMMSPPVKEATPLSARRARYERAKKRHGDKLGLPTKTTAVLHLASPAPSTTTKPPLSPVPVSSRQVVVAVASTKAVGMAVRSLSTKMTNQNKPCPAGLSLSLSLSTTGAPTPKSLIPASTASDKLLTSLATPKNMDATTTFTTPPLVPKQQATASNRSPLDSLSPNPKSAAARKSETLSAKLAKRSSFSSRTSWTKSPSPASNLTSTTPSTVSARTAAALLSASPATKTASKTPPPPSSSSKRSTTPAFVIRLSRTPLSANKSPTTSRIIVKPPTTETSTGGSTRRNLDKRTARLRYAAAFVTDIAQHKLTGNTSSPPPPPPPGSDPSVSVIVRKRPLFAHESEDFDVVHMADDQQSVCIYETKLQADMQTRVVQPQWFPCRRSYDETATNHQVYEEAVQPLVHMAMTGGAATVLMFGQTGSGKTYTMSSMEDYVAAELFADEKGKRQVQVKFLEITKKCHDLMNDGREVKLMDSTESTVQFVGATTVTVNSAEHFLQLLQQAKDARATEQTSKNDTSSRSHALCQISIWQDRQPTGSVGVLTLVDCAGTERRNDSLYHSKDRQTESAEINSSLYALKQCVRAKMSRHSTHIPFRLSNLTRALRESLEQPEARLLVIATIAPNATDTEHTMETLKTVVDLMGTTEEADKQVAVTKSVSPKPSTPPPSSLPVAPKNWTHDQLVGFLNSKRLLSPTTRLPDTMNGRLIMRMAKPQLRNAFFADCSDYDCGAKVDALFQSLRTETDRVARLEFKRRCRQSK